MLKVKWRTEIIRSSHVIELHEAARVAVWTESYLCK